MHCMQLRFAIANSFIFLWNTLVVLCSFDDIEESAVLTVEHRLSSAPGAIFTVRGQIAVRSYIHHNVAYQQINPVTREEYESLKELCRKKEFYRLRIPVKTGDQDDYVETFTSACSILSSRLRDTITLTVDNSGNLLGVHVAPQPQQRTSASSSVSSESPQSEQHSSIDQQEEEEDEEQPALFRTAVMVQNTAIGPAPDTASYIRRLDRERDEKAKAEQGDNRSFIAKYWMYLVPLFFFLVMASNQADPNAAGGR